MADTNTEQLAKRGESDLSRSKVSRVLREWDLEELGKELERRWLGKDGEEQSLRSLEEWFNTQIMHQALIDAGQQPVEEEPRNLYYFLTGEDVSSGDRTQVTQRLERNGLDVAALEDDFVTYNAIYSYLTEVRGVSKSKGADTPVANARDRVQRLEARLKSVASDVFCSLQSAGHIADSNIDIVTKTTIVCKDCGRSYDIDEYTSNRGCDCD
jgi:hypothetical protein